MRRFLALAALLLAVPLSARAAELAGHRALYTLTLESVRNGSVQGASGIMSYEVNDACDGWAVRQRLEMTLSNRDGQDIQMLSEYATLESKDGLSLRFHMRQTTDTAVTSQADGEATLEKSGGPGEARYTSPGEFTKKLPAGTLFPMAHTNAIIEAARAGRKVIALPLFDGTSETGAQDSSVAILDWTAPEKTPWPALNPLPSTRVRIAFFDPGDITPDYEVGMRYWENGIADDLHMDFGDFVMHGVLKELAVEPKRC